MVRAASPLFSFNPSCVPQMAGIDTGGTLALWAANVYGDWFAKGETGNAPRGGNYRTHYFSSVMGPGWLSCWDKVASNWLHLHQTWTGQPSKWGALSGISFSGLELMITGREFVCWFRSTDHREKWFQEPDSPSFCSFIPLPSALKRGSITQRSDVFASLRPVCMILLAEIAVWLIPEHLHVCGYHWFLICGLV